MHSAWIQFSKDINQLIAYIDFLSESERIFKFKLSEEGPVSSRLNEKMVAIRSSLNNLRSKKVLEYNLCIVTLYGILERYIEDICIQYLELVASHVSHYSKLPVKIKNNHVNLTSSVMQKLGYPKYKNVALETLVKNLNDCINDDQCSLNAIVFADHTANFRHSVVIQMFNRLNIDELSSKLKQSPLIHDYLELNYGTDNDNVRLRDTTVFGIIDQLADRRNDVSHGVDNGEPILSLSNIRDYVDFVKIYGESILDVLAAEELSYLLENNFSEVSTIAVFNNIILCIKLEDNSISIGDEIVVQTPDERLYKSTVNNIQINKVDKDDITAAPGEAIDIALLLDRKVKDNYKFYLKKNSN